jgi:hypothetical protein
MKEGSRNGTSLSPRELYEGNMEGRSFPGAFERMDNFLYLGKFYEKFERYVKKRPCKRAALSIGPLLGNLEGFVYWVY